MVENEFLSLFPGGKEFVHGHQEATESRLGLRPFEDIQDVVDTWKTGISMMGEKQRLQLLLLQLL